MNVLEHYVIEIIGKPYYHDYGSGKYRWWLLKPFVTAQNRKRR